MAESSTNMCSSTNEEFGEEANVITMVDVLKEEQELEDDAKAVLGGSDDQNCTYSKGYVKRQALYACMTCIPLGDDAPPGGICLACSYFCHEGHELVELYTKRNFRCDCGNSRFKNNKCNLEPNKDDMNELNNYNQNFRGVYCTCSRPYPDPEDNTEDEMIQCIVCEDWYHGRHLGSPVPALNDYGEMVCGTCMEKHPFLWHYKGFAATIVSPEEATTSKVEVVKSEVENSVVYPVNTNGLDKPEMKLDTVIKQECYIKDLSLAADLQGAVFFSEGWRKQLCTCTKCQELYEFQKVSFLLDEQDTVQAYEEKGKAKGEAGQPASQYEQGLKALSSLDRIKQVEAIEGNMDVIKYQDLTDILIDNPSFFSTLTYEEKLEVKTKRSTPNLSLKQFDGHYTRHFKKQWYDTKPWLTGSVKKNRLYCFYCLLFSRNGSEWCKVGLGEDALKNFMAKAKRHECSNKHLTATVKFNEFGTKRIGHALTEAARLSAIKHNEKVDQNRSVLKRLISAVCFLAKQELCFQGEDESEDPHNKGNYLEMLDFLAEQEPHLKAHLIHSKVCKGTSPDVQNDLISCIAEVINDQISNEVNNSPFVSVQVDEMSDVSTKSQLSIILRYANILSGEVEERFVGFYDVSSSKTTESVAGVLLKVLDTWKISKEKLICQTYDGSSVMGGKNDGVNVLIKQYFPYALFIHCYMHRLNLVFLHCCNVITQVKIFIANLTGFNRFFSRSSRRDELLIERGFKLPSPSKYRWNSHSRNVDTILQHYDKLFLALNDIVENEGWDSNSVHQAEGLINILHNVKFIFFLVLYSNIFMFTDVLCNVLHSKIADISLCNREIWKCLKALKSLKHEDKVNEWVQRSRDILSQHLTEDEIHNKFNINVCGELGRLSYEVLDTIIVNFQLRFRDFRNLEFFELMNEAKFEQYSRPKQFPEAKVDMLCELYPFFDKDKLKGELMLIFRSEDKRLPSKHLFKYLINNDLKDNLSETVKLLSLMLSIPATTASCERNVNPLKRVKTHMRSSVMNTRLSNLSTLAIEKMSLKMSSRSPEFLSRVIDVFAAKKDRGIELVYKKV